jgi:hypothetical protein
MPQFANAHFKYSKHSQTAGVTCLKNMAVGKLGVRETTTAMNLSKPKSQKKNMCS